MSLMIFTDTGFSAIDIWEKNWLTEQKWSWKSESLKKGKKEVEDCFKFGIVNNKRKKKQNNN